MNTYVKKNIFYWLLTNCRQQIAKLKINQICKVYPGTQRELRDSRSEKVHRNFTVNRFSYAK